MRVFSSLARMRADHTCATALVSIVGTPSQRGENRLGCAHYDEPPVVSAYFVLYSITEVGVEAGLHLSPRKKDPRGHNRSPRRKAATLSQFELISSRPIFSSCSSLVMGTSLPPWWPA